MKKFTALALVIVFVLSFAGCSLLIPEPEEHEILTSYSEDGSYSLTVYMIGDPEWPYGKTHCRVDLFHNDATLTQHPFSVLNDGGPVHESSFAVTWNAESVTVVASGCEQLDTAYLLYFDGTVEEQVSTD